MYNSFIVLAAVSALFLLLNAKLLKLTPSIGLLILGMVLSLILLVVKNFIPEFYDGIPHSIEQLDFNYFLMQVILPFLLFSGAIHVDMSELKKQKFSVFTFAIFSTLISTILVGYLSFYTFQFLGINISLLYCMLFGALISPTDPIAVLSIFKNYKVKSSLTMKIEGESLFNDGIGIVIFVTIAGILNSENADFNFSEISMLFAREAVGGIVFGLIIGWVAIQLLKQLNQSKHAIITTLIVATFSYSLANNLEVSGALAMVSSGLVIGNWLPTSSNTNIIRDTTMFWEVMDELFNAMLFVLIGFSIIQIDPSVVSIWAGVLAIIIVLLSRFVSVSIPHIILDTVSKEKNKGINEIVVLTWSGLRGGLAFALALSLINQPNGEFIIYITYVVATFSIVVQGLTIGKLVDKLGLG